MRTKILFLSALLLTVACASTPPAPPESASTENSNYTDTPQAERAPAGEIAGSWNLDQADYSNGSYRGAYSWGGNNNWWGEQPQRQRRGRGGRGGYSRYPRRHFPQSSTCSAAGAAAWIVKIGQATHSSHQCLSAVRAAYGGCSAKVIDAIHSYQHGMNSMRAAGWRCGYTHNPYEAPEGAAIAEANHIEIRVGNCFYSDFHVVNCKPGTKYSHNPRHMYGWCMP